MKTHHNHSHHKRRSSNRSHYKKDYHSKSERYRSRSKYNDKTYYNSNKYHNKPKNKRYSSISSSSGSSSSSSDSSQSKSYSSASQASHNYSSVQKSVKIITSGSTQKRRNAPHYRFQRGQKVGHKYWIKDILGDGTFGRVLRGQYQRKSYAIKVNVSLHQVIKPVQKYIKSAKVERNIIKEINQQDSQDKYGIVRIIESFYHRNHFCIVFQQLGSSLYDLIKKNKYKGFPRTLVKKFFYQILKTLSFIHKFGYTHTDLKPENILLQKDDFEIRKDYRGVERYCYPLQTKLRIIDFGSATKYNQHHSSIINTRQYRSPQVLLQCCKWNELSDVWSVGCIIVELYTGNLLFDTHKDYEHLAMIAKNCGILPSWMIRQSKNDLHKIFNEEGQIRQIKLRKYVGEGQNIIYMKTVNQIFNHDYLLKDVLTKCLQVDPKKRISCAQALMHKYFQNFNSQY